YSFVPKPQKRYYVKVNACCNTSSGNYTLVIRPQKAYDSYEPNDDILHASVIAIGKTIEAGIMDREDVDFYAFDVEQPIKLVASLENRSATLAPEITIYNPDKSRKDGTYNGTAGSDVKYSFEAQAKGRYYVRVNTCCNSRSGNYALTI